MLIVTAIGAVLPKNHTASAVGTVQVPPSQAFATILDVGRYPEWRSDVKDVAIVGTSPLRWREHGVNGVITYELLEQHAPDRLVIGIADPALPFGGTWTYALTAAGEGTRVAMTERGEIRNPAFRFVSRVFLSQTATMKRFLADLGHVRG